MHKVLGGVGLFVGLFPGLAAASEGGGFINLDWSLPIQALNFGLLLLVLWRFLYRPFLAKLEEDRKSVV